MINGPHSPDRAHQLAEVGDAARAEGWPLEISSALIGSCTNSSYEDITRAASIARQASAKGLRVKTQLLITPGSEQMRATIERDGLLADLEAIGGTVLANACGPVHRPVGSHRPRHLEAEHDRQQLQPQLPEAQRRQRQHPELRHLPRHGHRAGAGRHPRLRPAHRHAHQRRRRAGAARPARRPGPARRRVRPRRGHLPGAARRRRATWRSSVDPHSERLQLLEAFEPWDGNDYERLPILLKAQGKCTTDHISAAGPWLKYRGHLENISGNLYLGAVNAFTGEAGTGKDPLDGETRPFPDIAKRLHEAGIGWVAIGDENLGEGSSREHAAMEPRFRNAKVILARSFARIHETNLKKQGLLPLTFADPGHLRPDRRGRHHQRARPRRPGARHARAVHDQQARRHHESTSRATTPSATSRSSGSAPAAPSTSSAGSTARSQGSGRSWLASSTDASRSSPDSSRYVTPSASHSRVLAAKRVVSGRTLPSRSRYCSSCWPPAIQYAASSPTLADSRVVPGPRCFSITARSVEPGISVSSTPTPVAATAGDSVRWPPQQRDGVGGRLAGVEGRRRPEARSDPGS